MKGLPAAGPRLLPPGCLLLREDTAGPARRYERMKSPSRKK